MIVKKGRSLYSIFIVNSIITIVVFIIGIIIFLSLLLSQIAIGISKNNINFDDYKNDSFFKERYSDIDIKQVLDEGGWIEQVKDNKIVNVIGDKKDKVKNYSIEYLINEKDNIRDNNYESKVYKDESTIYIVKMPTYEYRAFQGVYKNINIKLYTILSMIITIMIVSTIVIILAVISIKKLSKPLKILEQEIKKMSEGYSDVEVNFKSYREFNNIKESFNNTVAKLKQAEEENKLIEDSKKRIIRDISHDIKTPITSVLGYSKAILEERVIDEDEKKLYLRYIYNKTNRINYLVDELFIFSKMDSPGYKLDLKKQDFSEFIREVLALYYIDIEAKGFKLEVDIPEVEIYSMIDKKELERAIVNIINNSLKYNKKGTKLKVGLYKEHNYVYLIIEDDGIGISDSISKTVFEEFVRSDKSRKSDGGSGLGLAITRKIIKLHNGDIKLNSKEGIGTRFDIKLKTI